MAVEITYTVAAVGGLVSFLSPCVLPLVPAYLCFVAGTSLEEMVGEREDRPRIDWRVVAMSLVFVIGFSTVFVLLGASASAVSRLLYQHLDVISKIAGALIVIFGLHFMGLFRIPLLNREARFQGGKRPAGPVGAYVAGLAFGFGWTPCIGPILATILTIAASSDRLGYGVSLLTVYSLGLGIPFLLAALAINPFMRFAARFRRHMHKVELAAGGMLVATGLLIFFNQFQVLAYWMIELFPGLAEIG
ncbi:cytochrome c biogenesis CcdA family protein [Oceanibacterium hippocampi]|uniref:Thiol:disulfide interchange protein n=1 Tax=Oceanibacterium hippocampi TaxID=745714 RepID=A0A1Y5SKE3_9PROT|nr:cytochrome c biogenesis protein CcdA [Oceanibacterium hippocampi]SLN39700.1 thiol:disulfide interchange protein precursor [Oceanibacterium hippocampi]